MGFLVVNELYERCVADELGDALVNCHVSVLLEASSRLGGVIGG